MVWNTGAAYVFWKLDIGLYLRIIEESATVNPLIIVLMKEQQCKLICRSKVICGLEDDQEIMTINIFKFHVLVNCFTYIFVYLGFFDLVKWYPKSKNSLGLAI